MKNQKTQVTLTLHEAINLVQTDYTELNNIKPSDYTKEEYKEICINAIEFYENAAEDEDKIRELFNSIKIDFLAKEDYKDILIQFYESVDFNRCDPSSDSEVNLLKLIDDKKADFLGPDLYADVCKEAMRIVTNIKDVKTKLFEGNENNHYYDICMEAVESHSVALNLITIELLTAEQLKELVMQALKSFDGYGYHPLEMMKDRDDIEMSRNKIKESLNKMQTNALKQNAGIYTKLEGKYYEEICTEAIQNDAIAVQYIMPKYLNEGVYEKLAILAVENYQEIQQEEIDVNGKSNEIDN